MKFKAKLRPEDIATRVIFCNLSLTTAERSIG